MDKDGNFTKPYMFLNFLLGKLRFPDLPAGKGRFCCLGGAHVIGSRFWSFYRNDFFTTVLVPT